MKLSENSFVLSKSIPSQLSEAQGKAIESAGSSVSTTTASTIAANIALSFILGASLSQLWSMINGVQIMAHIMLIQIVFAANISMMISYIMEIATFDLIDTDDPYEDIF